MSNRIVIYKACKYHNENMARLVDEGQAECRDCKHLTFRATMRARGISVSVPSYKGGWGLGFGPGWKSQPGDKPGMREPGVFACADRIPGR